MLFKLNFKIFALLYLLTFFVNGQDTIYFRNGQTESCKVKIIGVENITFKKFNNIEGPDYIENKNGIEKIKYNNGTLEYFEKSKNSDKDIYIVNSDNVNEVTRKLLDKPTIKNFDSIYHPKHVFKFHVSAPLSGKISVAYELYFRKKYLWEIQPRYIFKNIVNDVVSNLLIPNIAFKYNGFEIITGFSKFSVRTKRNKPFGISRGFYISYCYEHTGKVNYWSGGMSGSSYYYSYDISQTRNSMSLFYKINRYSVTKKVSLDFYYSFGVYVGIARTVCFRYSGPDSGTPMGVYDPSGLFFTNGLFVLPFFRVGTSLRFNKASVKI